MSEGHFPFYLDPFNDVPTMDWAVQDFKRKFLRTVLIRTRGNQCEAAKLAGVHRNTMLRMCQQLEIDAKEFKKRRYVSYLPTR